MIYKILHLGKHCYIALKNCELEYRKSNIKLHFSAYHEKSVGCAKTTQFQFEDLSTDKKLSINTLMEEVKPNTWI